MRVVGLDLAGSRVGVCDPRGCFILTSCGRSSKGWETNQRMAWFRRKHSGLTGSQTLFPELLEPLLAYGRICADLEEVVVFMQMHKTLRQSVFPASKVVQAPQDS